MIYGTQAPPVPTHCIFFNLLSPVRWQMHAQGDGTLGVFGAPGSGVLTGKSLVVWNSRTGPSNGSVFAKILNT